jgi:multicomponent Na+:H+ antiporter subunit F
VFELLLDGVLTWLVGLMFVVILSLPRPAETARRLVLMDLSVMLLVCTLVVLSIRRDETYFLDAALALSLLSFVGTIAIASYAARRPDPD